ncbi:MAG: DUF2849 domain-containing protein [Pseudomonadota bacterium]
MPRRDTPKVITANDLIGGHVVYLTEDDRWTRDPGDAELIEDEAHADIRLLDASRRSGEVVGVYLADARSGPNGPEPIHLRELIRAKGPTIPAGIAPA